MPWMITFCMTPKFVKLIQYYIYPCSTVLLLSMISKNTLLKLSFGNSSALLFIKSFCKLINPSEVIAVFIMDVLQNRQLKHFKILWTSEHINIWIILKVLHFKLNRVRTCSLLGLQIKQLTTWSVKAIFLIERVLNVCFNLMQSANLWKYYFFSLQSALAS